MLMIKNELLSAAIMSGIVATLVWWNAPREIDETCVDIAVKCRSWATFIRAYVISFIITFVIFYFTSDSGTDEVIDNMIKGLPDF